MAKSRDWCFTLNNPTPEKWPSHEAFMARLRDAYPQMTYLVFCLEVGEEKTPHWQGFMQFTNPVALSKLNKVTKGAHLEQRRGTAQQAVDYIKRTGEHTEKGGLLEGPWEWGELEGRNEQGKRTDIAAMLDLHLEMGGGPAADVTCARQYGSTWVRYGAKCKERSQLLLAHEGKALPEPREIIWHYGPTGTGKTRRVYELEGTAVDVVTLSGTDKEAPFFNGMFGLEAMLLDDLRPSAASFSFFLRLFDRYPLTLNTKGTSAPLVAKRIYVTSHFSPVDFAAMAGGVAEDPTQLTRRLTKVVDFSKAEADRAEPEVIDITDEEKEEPPLKRPRLERHKAMSHLEEEVLVQEAMEVLEDAMEAEDSGDDADED